MLHARVHTHGVVPAKAGTHTPQRLERVVKPPLEIDGAPVVLGPRLRGDNARENTASPIFVS